MRFCYAGGTPMPAPSVRYRHAVAKAAARPAFSLAVFVLALTLVSRTSEAQYGVSPTFGCSEGAVMMDLTDRPALSFERADSIPDLNPTNTKEYSFTFQKGHVRSIVVHVSTSTPELGWGRGTVAPFDLYAATTSMGAAEAAYWHLAEGEKAPYSELSLAYTAPSDPNVSLATHDTDLPLLHARYLQDQGGANADNWTEQHLLLDFRAPEPKAFASASCGYNMGGGACTAYDGVYRIRASAVSCTWQASRDLYRCEWHDNDTRAWGTRVWDRALELGGAPNTPAETRLPWPVDGDPWSEPRPAGSLGPPSYLMDLPSAIPGETLRLVASPGFSFTPRLFLARLRSGSPPQVSEIQVTPIGPPPQSQEAEVALRNNPQTLGVPVADPSFTARVLQEGGGDSPYVIALVVREQEHKELIWVGVQDDGMARALVVADDTSEYVQCTQAVVSANARRIEIEKGPGFVARIELEPARWTSVASEGGLFASQYLGDQNAGPVGPPCPGQWQVTWEHGVGFRQTDLGIPPSTFCLVESIEISDAGHVAPAGNVGTWHREPGGWPGFSWVGHGEPTVLLLDTWAGDRQQWAATVRELRDKRRVVVVHADWNTKPLTADTIARDVSGVAAELQLGRVVVVGVGFDSFIARRVARELGPSATGIIEVDPPVSLGTATDHAAIAALLMDRSKRYQQDLPALPAWVDSDLREDLRAAQLSEWSVPLVAAVLGSQTPVPPHVPHRVLRHGTGSAGTFEGGHRAYAEGAPAFAKVLDQAVDEVAPSESRSGGHN